MRILVAHLVGAARSGGMSRLMGRVHDELASSGHHVEYLTADDVAPVLRGRAGRVAFQWLVRQTLRAAAREGQPFDIVNVHEPHGAVVASIRAGLGPTAVVAMTHGVERRGWEIARSHVPSRPSLKTRLLYPATSLWLSGIALRRADHVICLNGQDREYLERRFGIDRGRVTAVIPGADPIFARAAASRSYERAERLLFAGTWLPRKGIVELAGAFDALVDRGSNVFLDVLGPGVPERDVLRSFSPTARSRVRVLGGGDDSMMADAMAAADVFVLPSLFEGTPLTLIEAMWSGLPVVTTRTAGMQDVVEHERTGILVPPGDRDALLAALIRVADKELRRSIGRAAHETAASRYTWTNTAGAFAAAYAAARARHAASTS
jgi:glycosyltransferase involved in cell wall biosynthesis